MLETLEFCIDYCRRRNKDHCFQQKKPAMEKQRRDRMNRAMDELKTYLLKYDPTHPSKLEKADILEKTVELMMRFDQGKIVSQRGQQEVFGLIMHSFMMTLQSRKSSPEVMKIAQDVFQTMRNPVNQQIHQQNNYGFVRHPYPVIPPMNHNANGFPIVSNIHPNLVNSNAFQHILTQNALQTIFSQQGMNNCRIGNPLMASSPKINNSCSNLNTKVNSNAESFKSSVLSSTSMDSRPETADDISSESDEEIDVENVDENDSLSSVSTSRGKKRSLSSSTGDMEDSGVFEPIIKRPKTFSIDGLLKES